MGRERLPLLQVARQRVPEERFAAVRLRIRHAQDQEFGLPLRVATGGVHVAVGGLCAKRAVDVERRAPGDARHRRRERRRALWMPWRANGVSINAPIKASAAIRRDAGRRPRLWGEIHSRVGAQSRRPHVALECVACRPRPSLGLLGQPIRGTRAERRQVLRGWKRAGTEPTSGHAMLGGIPVVVAETAKGMQIFSVAEIVLVTFVGPRPSPTAVAAYHRDGDVQRLRRRQPRVARAGSADDDGGRGGGGGRRRRRRRRRGRRGGCGNVSVGTDRRS